MNTEKPREEPTYAEQQSNDKHSMACCRHALGSADGRVWI
jgi:hypothetical protein